MDRNMLNHEEASSELISHSWWTAAENDTLQNEYRTKSCLWINRSDIEDVDHIVYKYCPVREHLINLHKDLIQGGLGYGHYEQIPVYLQMSGEYAVFVSRDWQKLAHRLSFDTLEEASEYIRKNYTEENKEQSVPYQYIVVKLSDLLLEFSLLFDQFAAEKKNEFYFIRIDNLEELDSVLATAFIKK